MTNLDVIRTASTTSDSTLLYMFIYIKILRRRKFSDFHCCEIFDFFLVSHHPLFLIVVVVVRKNMRKSINRFSLAESISLENTLNCVFNLPIQQLRFSTKFRHNAQDFSTFFSSHFLFLDISTTFPFSLPLFQKIYLIFPLITFDTINNFQNLRNSKTKPNRFGRQS